MLFSDIYKKGFGAPTPSDLIEGGIGIDVTNKKAYSKGSDGQIFQLGLTDAEVQALIDATTTVSDGLAQELLDRASADNTLQSNIDSLSGTVTTLDGANVKKTSVQALHSTDALRISGSTLYLYKGNGTNESVALSSSYDAGKSFAGNGYQKLTNGLILQWGSGTGTRTFPIAFPTACLNVQATQQLGGIEYDEVTVNILSTSQVAIYTTNTGGTVYWFAIGY